MQSKSMSAAARTVAVLGLLAAPGAAQAQEPDYEAIVRMMQECSKIDGVAARAACYDNTLAAERLISRSTATPSAPDRAGPAAAQGPAAAPARPATGFGAESVREPARARAQAEEIELVVRQADRLEPGIYALTLDDGSTWRFVDAVPQSYDAPRAGSRIELARAALGSFQMRYANQRPVRIRRVR